MKKLKLALIPIFAVLMLLSTNLEAQNFRGLDKSPMDAASFPSSYKVSDKLIKVVYSRPQLKGRSVSKLAPNDKVWRTGANEAAEITLFVDMKLGDGVVKAGTYSLFTIPGDTHWTVILNSDSNVWGAYTYNEANDVARIKVPVTEAKESLEAFSIAFEKAEDGAHLHMGWGTLRVAVPFAL